MNLMSTKRKGGDSFKTWSVGSTVIVKSEAQSEQAWSSGVSGDGGDLVLRQDLEMVEVSGR